MGNRRWLVCVIALTISLTSGLAHAADPKWSDAKWDQFLGAIRLCETNGKPNEGIGAKGDWEDGEYKAIGPYQIHECYWQDACEADPSLKNKTYQDCLTDKAYSEKVVKTYMIRYLPKGGTPEDAARIHNGGPSGHKRKSTLPYLTKFRKWYKNMTDGDS